MGEEELGEEEGAEAKEEEASRGAWEANAYALEEEDRKREEEEENAGIEAGVPAGLEGDLALRGAWDDFKATLRDAGEAFQSFFGRKRGSEARGEEDEANKDVEGEAMGRVEREEEEEEGLATKGEEARSMEEV